MEAWGRPAKLGGRLQQAAENRRDLDQGQGNGTSCKTWRLLSQDNQATVTQGGGGHEEVISTVALGAWTVVST